jgi:hypothetical protein
MRESKSARTRGRRWGGWSLAIVAIGVVAVELLSLGVGGIPGALAEHSPVAGSNAPVPAAGTTASTELSAAQASLSAAGPAPSAKAAPSARVGASMTYDAKDGYVLLAGGENFTGFLTDTWKFAGGVWTQLKTAGAPPASYNPGLVYDAKDGYVVLFSGNETWKYVAGSWTQLTPTRSPPVVYAFAMTYDAKDGYALLFGGYNGTSYLSETWKFVGGQWSKIVAAAAPPSRAYASMAYDAADGYVVLFGGCHTAPPCTSGYFYSDTWKFSGGSWTKLAPTTHPSGRGGYVMTFDTAAGSILLFGGCNSTNCSKPLGDTWTFAAGSWTHLKPTTHPPGRVFAAGTYDTKDKEVLMFSGVGRTGILGDTWAFSSGNWKKA